MSSLTLSSPTQPDLLPSGLPPRPWVRRLGTYLHVYIIAGIAAPVMIYLALMQTLGWPTPSLGLNGLMGFVASTSDEIVLYDSKSSRAFFSSQGGNQDVLLNPWRDYLKDRGVRFREVQDASQLRKLSEGVLILASAVALSEPERAEIQAFRARGGAVLATWATGTRDDKGNWIGWNFIEEIGFRVTGEIKDAPQINHLIVNGESPVSHTLLAGQRIFMSATTEPLLIAQGGSVAARFMNWARTPIAGHLNEGAVLFAETTPQAGRTAFFGFAESAWANHAISIYSLIDDTLSWLHREPAVVRAAWPRGKLAASVIEMDTEEGFGNAVNFAGLAQAADHPTSFFILTSVALQFPDVLRQLGQAHELGYHGDIHTSFKDLPELDQEKRVKTMRAQMKSIIPDTAAMTGFRAPTEGYDATTEKVLQRNSLRYHVADPNRGEVRLPLFAQVPGAVADNDIVVLPRTQRDDLNALKESTSTDDLTQALIADTDLALDNGALALLSIHTQNFAANSPLARAMPGMLLHAKQLKERMWLATSGEVANWWRERERVQFSPSYKGRRLEMAVSITGANPVSGASFIVFLPQKDVSMSVKSTKIGGVLPTVRTIDAYRKVLIFPGLPPGNHSYQITFGS